LRVRHSDDSGDAYTQWSPWSYRTFHTGSATQVFPLEIEDVAVLPALRWIVAGNGSDVILPPAATPSSLQLESGAGQLLLGIEANDGVTNTITNPPALLQHTALRIQLRGGALG